MIISLIYQEPAYSKDIDESIPLYPDILGANYLGKLDPPGS